MDKGFFNNFIPDYRFKKITDIAPDFFGGGELVILDLDNTLVFSGTTNTEKEIVDWVRAMKEQYHCIIFSNSFSFSKRAPEVAKIFGCEIFPSKHKKPFKKLFLEMKDKYHFDDRKVFVVGDRVFTDILFGNTNNAKTVLIDKLSWKENFFVILTRILESLILYLSRATYYT